jgi:glutamate carboxypeptidase
MTELLRYNERQLGKDLEFLEAMVNLDSPSFDKPLVDRFVRFLATRFEEIGGRVEYVAAERFGDHLVARFSGESDDRVLLLGHTDTVFSVGEAARRPFKAEHDKATGPGVFDMKAGILLMWSALGALIRVNGRLSRSVTVLLTSDEEVGSNSSRALIETEARQARAVLVLEPSLPGGVLKTARSGVGRFTIKSIGRAAHAGVDPSKGINAIEEAAHQVLRLQRMSDIARRSIVTAAMIQGGTRPNVVPAEAAIEVDVRAATTEEAERIATAIRSLQPQLSGTQLEVHGGFNRPPMERTADTARLFEIARSVGEELGLDVKEGSTGGASDGNFTAALGIPTLDGLGAVGDGAHSLDEYVEISSLPLRSALIAELIERV